MILLGRGTGIIGKAKSGSNRSKFLPPEENFEFRWHAEKKWRDFTEIEGTCIFCISFNNGVVMHANIRCIDANLLFIFTSFSIHKKEIA